MIETYLAQSTGLRLNRSAPSQTATTQMIGIWLRQPFDLIVAVYGVLCTFPETKPSGSKCYECVFHLVCFQTPIL